MHLTISDVHENEVTALHVRSTDFLVLRPIFLLTLTVTIPAALVVLRTGSTRLQFRST